MSIVTRIIKSHLSCYVIIFLAALTISLAGVPRTGTLWPDGPRYANAGAMIHDWLLSGEILHPYQFAIANYCQYPAFNVPFHPPLYPGLLGLSFLLTGVSYLSARGFIALCLGGTGCFFFAVLRKLGAGRAGALGCTGLLLTTPQIVHWSRDTMSEVPGLCLILAASWVFLLWLERGQPSYCWLAFAIAEAAFLCRLTTAGILPAWFLFAGLSGRGRRLINVNVILCSLVYMLFGMSYVLFAARFARFEVAADGKAESLSWDNLSYFTTCLPAILTWGTTLAALFGLLWAFRYRLTSTGNVLFWTSWILSYTLFKAFMPTSLEIRHFFMAFCGLAGLAVAPFCGGNGTRDRRAKAAWSALAVGLILNLTHYPDLPRGVVGYEAVAMRLASLNKPGNIMMNCWHDQDLIFRYRVSSPGSRRLMIRGDRTLAIRLPSYARKETTVLAHSREDVLATVRRGRIRYFITCAPAGSKSDDRPVEMVLAHQVASENRADFSLVGAYPLLVEFDRKATRTGTIYVWEFLGDLPAGPSELQVLIPTAEMVLNKGKDSDHPR